MSMATSIEKLTTMCTSRTRTALLLALCALVTGCELPPPASQQQGFRGTGMVGVYAPQVLAKKLADNVVPAAMPAAPPSGTRAGDVYRNVQVLADLDVTEFTRLMTAITAWVSPEQGCAYCHQGADFADDSLYTKVVARRMLQMTQHINSTAQQHVAATGVTCYTCHRGHNVPTNVWYTEPGPKTAALAGNLHGQNRPNATVGMTALPFDPFSELFQGSNPIRIASTSALPTGDLRSIKDTEKTYGLMIHISKALGVNCTFCHNSRDFFNWDESPATRVTAWHGIQMVRHLNDEYLTPLQASFPANRLGPTGDAPKINCATCHQGANKPLGGVSQLGDYPELKGAP